MDNRLQDRTALLVSPLARDLDDPTALIGQALFWAFAAAVVANVLFWEKQPLRSLWLQQCRWQSIAWGLLLVAAYYTMLFPLGEWLRRRQVSQGSALEWTRRLGFPSGIERLRLSAVA